MLTHDLVESARQEGGDFYLVRRLHEMTDIAQRSGLERDDVANAMLAHAIGLCRPDPTSRKILAALLVKQARQLDRDAVDQAMARAQW
jgi:hypothetical protein